MYDGIPFNLKLPTLDAILPQLEKLDQDARLYKVDVARAFRNVRVDPGDVIHLCIQWKVQYFLDKNLPFGAVHGTAIFQRITDLIRFLMAKQGFLVHNYIDVIYAVCHKDHGHLAFETLKKSLNNMGLPLNYNKVFAPCMNLNIMGVTIDIKTRTFNTSPEKLKDIMQECYRCSSGIGLPNKSCIA